MEIKMLNVTLSHWWLLSPAFSPVEALNLRRKPICWTFDSMQRYLVIDRRCCKACTAAHYLIYQQRAPASPLLERIFELLAAKQLFQGLWGIISTVWNTRIPVRVLPRIERIPIFLLKEVLVQELRRINDLMKIATAMGLRPFCFSKTKQKVAGWYSYRLRQPGPTNKQDMVPASA